MTALAASRPTPQFGTSTVPDSLYIPVKAGAKIYAGALVALLGGYAKQGVTATGLIAVGVAEEDVDNTSGADGALSVRVRQGVFAMNNSSGGDAIAQANVGADCYIVDDNTVALTSGSSTRSRAGKVIRITASGLVDVQLAIGL
jgi:hypothetical protein